MEEPCDWAVCAEAAAPGLVAPPSSRTERKKKGKEEQEEEKRIHRQVENNLSNQQVQRHPALAPAAVTPLQATPTRREQQEALPKIPPLSSFKSRKAELVGLDQAEQLFHRFITAGSGRSVEVVREFRGQDGQGEEHEEGQREEGCRETITLPDDSPLALKTLGKWSHFLPRLTPTSPRPTPTSPGPMFVPQHDGDTSAPPAVRGETEHSSTSFCASSVQISGSANGMTSCPSPNPKPATAGRQSRRSRKSGDHDRTRTGGQSIGERRGGAWRQGVSNDDEEGEAWSPETYWGSSYRAWRDFYSSFTPPAGQPEYYGCYTAANHWMAAYRMNVVYMEELLKN